MRSVLKRIFQDRNVHFIDHVGCLQVDALSGMWDDSGGDGDVEYSYDYAELSRRLNIRQPSNNVHSHHHEPYPEDSESRGRAVGFSRIPSESDALQQQLRSYSGEEEFMTIENSSLNHPSTAPHIRAVTNLRQFNPPSLGSNMMYINEQSMMATQERLSQGIVTSQNDVVSNSHDQSMMATQRKPSQYTVAAHSECASQLYHVRDSLFSYSNEYTAITASSQRLRQPQTSLQHVPLPSLHATVLHPPPTGTTVGAAKQVSPQDHGTMLLYNPYDPIEHALQVTTTATAMPQLFFHGRNMGSLTRCRSLPMSNISDPYLNAVSGASSKSDTTEGEITRMHSHHRHCDVGASSIGGSRNDRGVKDNVARRLVPPAAAAAAPASRLLEGDGHGNTGHLSASNENYRLTPPPVLYIQQRVRSHSSSSPRDSDDIPIVSSRSSPATPASSSHRSDSEIHRAISESQAAHIVHTRQQVADDIEFRRSLTLASNESARNLDVELVDIDGHERILMAKEKYEAELELALRQSEYVHALRQEEDERIRASEEQLIADLLVRSRKEEESAERDEEEILREALAKSLEDGWSVDESELMDEAVKKSASVPTNQDETLEWVLKLSLEEKEKMDEEEEELIRKAMEHSMLDMARW